MASVVSQSYLYTIQGLMYCIMMQYVITVWQRIRLQRFYFIISMKIQTHEGWGESQVTIGFPSQRASNTGEGFYLMILWRHIGLRHDGSCGMEALSALLALCEGNPLVTAGFPHKGPVIWSFDVRIVASWRSCWTIVELLDMCIFNYEDVTSYKCFFALLFVREPTGHWEIHITKGQRCSHLIFPLLLTWTRCWTNSRIAWDSSLGCNDSFPMIQYVSRYNHHDMIYI